MVVERKEEEDEPQTCTYRAHRGRGPGRTECHRRWSVVGGRQERDASLAWLAHQGNYAAPGTVYEESLATARKTSDKLQLAFCLEGMASLLATQGEPVRAARLWSAAQALRKRRGVPILQVERAAYERAMERVRAQMGGKTFAIPWAEASP